ncbi:PadR family transcriptional regulator [Pseudonocardiaceae bacterium YIM PH 21723]|nr:PadR family transcriptional regulator [Pseudonocardiaceae bacterium YIM PH 21723]
MATRRKVSNPLALAVLASLLERPMHPYEMGRQLVERGKDRDFKFTRSSLYMVVDQCLRAGFCEEQETVRDTQRPERTVYRLTEPGRVELFDWLRELVAEPKSEYPAFGAALSLLMVLNPAEAQELLERRRDVLQAQVEEIRTTRQGALDAGVAWFHLIEEDYRLTVTEAELTFVTRLTDDIAKPDYAQTWHRYFGGKS